MHHESCDTDKLKANNMIAFYLNAIIYLRFIVYFLQQKQALPPHLDS